MRTESAQERRKRLSKERAKPSRPRYSGPRSWAIWVARAHFMVIAVFWFAVAWRVAETLLGQILACVTALASIVACFADPYMLRGLVAALGKRRI